MCFNRRWGTIGRSGWTESNTKVVCDALGFEISQTGKHTTILIKFNRNGFTGVNYDLKVRQSLSKPVHRSNIHCNTNDQILLDCAYQENISDADVIISCNRCRCIVSPLAYSTYVFVTTALCRDGDIKLVGRNSPYEGRLEMCFDKRWTVVGGNGWGSTDTKVACKELGRKFGYTPLGIYMCMPVWYSQYHSISGCWGC